MRNIPARAGPDRRDAPAYRNDRRYRRANRRREMPRGKPGAGQKKFPPESDRWSATSVGESSCGLPRALIAFDQIPNDVAGPAPFVSAIFGRSDEQPYRERGKYQVGDGDGDKRGQRPAVGGSLSRSHQRVVCEKQRDANPEALRLASARGFQSKRNS